MPEAAAPTDPAPGLYAVEQRTVARPPLTRDEQAVLDGYRVAGEHDKKRVKEICVTRSVRPRQPRRRSAKKGIAALR
jgi:hypothetical protein